MGMTFKNALQGGRILIETNILPEFAHCLTTYFQFFGSLLIMHLPHQNAMDTAEGGLNVLGEELIEEFSQTKNPQASSNKLELLEAVNINVSQVSLLLLVIDASRMSIPLYYSCSPCFFLSCLLLVKRRGGISETYGYFDAYIQE